MLYDILTDNIVFISDIKYEKTIFISERKNIIFKLIHIVSSKFLTEILSITLELIIGIYNTIE